MEKEKVTEELVRQNGNQAAAVMADYASQGGGGAPKGAVFGTFVDFYSLPCFKPSKDWPEEDSPRITDILADGYSLVQYRTGSASQAFYVFYIVKVTGSNPSVQLIGGEPVFTDCEPIKLDVPANALNFLILSTLIVDFSGPEAVFVEGVTEEIADISRATSLGEVTFTCDEHEEEGYYAVIALCAHATVNIGPE